MARSDAASEWADVLASVPLFAGLSHRHLKGIAALGKVQRLPAFTVMVRQGDKANSFYLLLDGAAVVRPPGRRAVKLGVGDYFGELALLDKSPRSASVEATEEVLVMRIPRNDFLRMLEKEPKVSLRLLQTLASRLRTSERSTSH